MFGRGHERDRGAVDGRRQTRQSTFDALYTVGQHTFARAGLQIPPEACPFPLHRSALPPVLLRPLDPTDTADGMPHAGEDSSRIGREHTM